ncbi:hypothetical protein, partial [Enterococcus faecium]|uniref:hypothetical protein n=1 Tax=Enterococcus faecium TaxID=1352 RepID=UPI001C544734
VGLRVRLSSLASSKWADTGGERSKFGLSAAQLHSVFIVIEKESEVGLVIEEANELKLTPQVGLRVRLSSLASSKWADTGGERSKFGLSAAQL